jgi:hypothetical protein
LIPKFFQPFADLCNCFDGPLNVVLIVTASGQRDDAAAQTATGSGMVMNPIRGTADVDYPVFASVPQTNFDCKAQEFPAGIYADVEARCQVKCIPVTITTFQLSKDLKSEAIECNDLCQVFWMCQADGRADAFLCPNGTIFNQQYFVCDWWYNVECESATNFFRLNEFLYQVCKSLLRLNLSSILIIKAWKKITLYSIICHLC